MFSAYAVTLLCLVCLGASADVNSDPCQELVRPLAELNIDGLDGRWVLIGGSLNDTADEKVLKERDSVSFYFKNATLTQVNRAAAAGCESHLLNITIEGHTMKLAVRKANFTATFLRTSCPDCIVFKLDLETPNYLTADFYLLSKRREVEQKEMEEFKAQAECLQMPPPVVMDPTKELCPEQTHGQKS